MAPQQVYGVRFQNVGKIYHFVNRSDTSLKVGDRVVVETSRGTELGWVATVELMPEDRPPESYKPIVRKATSHDLLRRQRYRHLEKEVLVRARMAAVEAGLTVKIAKAEYSFDGTRVTLYYGTEKRVNLTPVKRRLEKQYKIKVEFRQIGPRDVAKYLGGPGACGLETRCCSAFLTEFQPISIKMAKAQDLPLVPSEIAGMCGRLRCCLAYEYEFYKDASAGMPKVGKWVVTEKYSGKVVERNILKQTITLQTDQGRVEIPAQELWVGKSGQPPIAGGCGPAGGGCGGACTMRA
ncbi:MAG: regulatory iron-sulfur-containing complex subunit RicT [Ardenticatenia bacterium]|nr:regulatory iron-sulfur-containing complex subunit RicT [Ardenticatenia bacterium]